MFNNVRKSTYYPLGNLLHTLAYSGLIRYTITKKLALIYFPQFFKNDLSFQLITVNSL